MRLAVFDIDGTLTDTTAVDAECFAAALAEVLELPVARVGVEWRSYPHITDSGIANTAAERHLARAIEPQELGRVESRFVELLTTEFRREPQSCRPIPGATELLADLGAREDWVVAFATGGFRQSALLKLARAGFDPPPILATAGEAISRADITRLAMHEARELSGQALDSAVLIGDGIWDVAAGRELGLPCVGVGRGAVALELSAAGAVAVLEDYRDLEAALGVIAAAADGRLAVRS